MLKTLAIALALSFSATACTSIPDEPELQFEDDAAKADVVRPYGTFHRDLGDDEQGFTLLKLNEDRTYEASQELVRCQPGECTDAFQGTYRFASSRGKKYIVLYNDGAWWYSFEYKFDGAKLQLRYSDLNDWFTMELASSALVLGPDDDGGTFQVTEGDDVVVNLPSNASTGYSWKVVATDRTFGYPTETYTAADPARIGGGGTATLTWKTRGALSLVGEHTVQLEYRRGFDPDAPAARSFSFTVDVQPAE